MLRWVFRTCHGGRGLGRDGFVTVRSGGSGGVEHWLHDFNVGFQQFTRKTGSKLSPKDHAGQLLAGWPGSSEGFGPKSRSHKAWPLQRFLYTLHRLRRPTEPKRFGTKTEAERECEVKHFSGSTLGRTCARCSEALKMAELRELFDAEIGKVYLPKRMKRRKSSSSFCLRMSDYSGYSGYGTARF